jgi:hypothetical protein
MHRFKYVQKVWEDSDGINRSRLTLKARYSFRNETAPRDRYKVKVRLDNLCDDGIVPDMFYLDAAPKEVKARISLRPFLGAFLYAYAYGERIPPENIIDLDAIDRFILTGEKPNQPE